MSEIEQNHSEQSTTSTRFIDRILRLAMEPSKPLTINEVLDETNTILVAVNIFGK